MGRLIPDQGLDCLQRQSMPVKFGVSDAMACVGASHITCRRIESSFRKSENQTSMNNSGILNLTESGCGIYTSSHDTMEQMPDLRATKEMMPEICSALLLFSGLSAQHQSIFISQMNKYLFATSKDRTGLLRQWMARQ